MTLHLVLGGTRSGKSARAERRAAASGLPVAYLATGAASDAEMAERVAAHRRRRPASWTTVERHDIGAALGELPPHTCVLVDDLDGWVTHQMTAAGLWTDDDVAALDDDGRAAWSNVLDEAAAWARIAALRPGPVLVVAGQPGGGLAPIAAATRRWIDLHGDVARTLSTIADDSELVVAGRPLPLPGPESAPVAVLGDPLAGPCVDRPAPHPAPPEPAPATEAATPHDTGESWLREHGDTQIPPGAIDLAVNVLEGPPAWLAERLAAAVTSLAPYPDQRAARAAAAARHRRSPEDCLLLNGAAEGFWLLAQVLRPRLAACVHPTFTEGEAALRASGVPVHRVFREPERWRLDPAAVPDEADLVLLTRPDNPTGVLDPVASVERLCRPGRTVLVDEAFADFLPSGGDLAERDDLPGLVVVRSLTKLWGIAGLRTGYLLADRATTARLDAAGQPWPVNSLALDAVEACVAAETERLDRVRLVAERRTVLHDALATVPGVRVWPGAANFLLMRTGRTDLRERLLGDGLALRRGDTFPGLDAHYLRIAVREPSVTDTLRAALLRHLEADSWTM